MADETPGQSNQANQPDQPKRENPFRRQNFRRYNKPKNFSTPKHQEGGVAADSAQENVQQEAAIPTEQSTQQAPPTQRPQRQEPRRELTQQPRQPHQQRVLVSVVVPLLNEEESLRELSEQIKNALAKVSGNYEIIFVDDGSTDNSYKVLRELNQRNRRIKAIRFRRNYGKSAALMVAFQKAQGEFVITMDADLQDDPAEIPNLIRELRAGYDVVSGWKKKRYDPISKTLPSKFFNFVTGIVTGINIHDFNCGLKGYRSDVVKSVNVYGELHRYIPALAHWLGFRIGEIPVNHRARKYGKTKFGIGRFFKGFLDLLTVIFTTRYITRPLHLFGGWGIISSLIGIGIGGWLTFEKIAYNASLGNRPLFLISLIMVIVGVQFISIGLLGELITKGHQMEKEYSIKEEIR